MKALPVLPEGCTLTTSGLDAQQERADALRRAVRRVERGDDELRVEFGPDVDERVLSEFVKTERTCCSFLRIDYSERRLRIAVDDPKRRPTLDAFAGFIEAGEVG